MRTNSETVLAILILGLISCAPLPIYRLQPIAEQTRWLHGRELSYAAHEGIAAELGFVRSEGRDLVFEVWIRNDSARAFVVAPERFYYVPLHSAQEDGISSQEKQHALNPEAHLLQIDKEMAREHASQSTTAMLDATSAVLEVVEDVAKAGEAKSKEQIKEEEHERREEAQARYEREAAHEDKLSRLQRTRAYWEVQPLRKTTLEVQQSLEGLVHFPASEGALTRYIKLVMPLGETELAFVFTQQKIKP